MWWCFWKLLDCRLWFCVNEILNLLFLLPHVNGKCCIYRLCHEVEILRGRWGGCFLNIVVLKDVAVGLNNEIFSNRVSLAREWKKWNFNYLTLSIANIIHYHILYNNILVFICATQTWNLNPLRFVGSQKGWMWHQDSRLHKIRFDELVMATRSFRKLIKCESTCSDIQIKILCPLNDPTVLN